MRELKERLEEIREENPYLANYVLLAEAITGMQLTRRNIFRFVRSFVPEEEYEKSDLRKLADHLFSLSHNNIDSHTKSVSNFDSKRRKNES
jgi:hypothetical protein